LAAWQGAQEMRHGGPFSIRIVTKKKCGGIVAGGGRRHY
jgi:hypothetical protein